MCATAQAGRNAQTETCKGDLDCGQQQSPHGVRPYEGLGPRAHVNVLPSGIGSWPVAPQMLEAPVMYQVQVLGWMCTHDRLLRVGWSGKPEKS